MTALDYERILSLLAVGSELAVGSVTVERVVSPFGDVRFAVYRDGEQLTAGTEGDVFFGLTEAAVSLAQEKGKQS